MSKCNSYVCDICNKHIEDDEGMLIIKGKRRWYGWEESGWEHKRIHICRDCQTAIQKRFSAVTEKIKMNLFDKEEIHPNCTVQVLTNTVTGEVSIGWWENDNPPIGFAE